MDQLLWLLTRLPDWFWHAVTATGLAGILLTTVFLRWVPGIALYRIGIQIISFVLFTVGVFYEGGMDCRNAAQAQNAAFREAEQKGQEANEKIEEVIIEEKTKIEYRTKTQVEYVDRLVQGPERIKEITKDMSAEERTKFESKVKELEDSIKNCAVPSIVIEEINKAAKGGRQ